MGRRKNAAIWDAIRNKTGGRYLVAGGNKSKKGPWTADEDAILEQHVRVYGEARWNDPLRKGLLRRCGQSCRFRWFNHLSFKGDFSPEEEHNLLLSHAKFGNCWSLIAEKLPGRTQNEIRNYWNARFRRCVREGVPVYPPEILQELKARDPNQQLKKPPKPPRSYRVSSSSSLPFQNPDVKSSFSSYEQDPNFRCNPSSSFSSHQTKGMAPPKSSLIKPNPDSSSFSSLPIYYVPQFYQSQQTSLGTNPIPSMDELSDIFGKQVPSLKSSFQEITPTSCFNDMDNHFVVPTNLEDYSRTAPELFSERRKGYLEDLFKQPRVSSHSQLQQSRDEKLKGKAKMDDFVMVNDHNNNYVVSVPNGNYMTSTGGSNSSAYKEVETQAIAFQNLSLVDYHEGSWLDIPPDGPPKELDHFRDDAYVAPENPTIGLIAAAADNQQTVVSSTQISVPSGNDMTFGGDSSSGFLSDDMRVDISKDDIFKDVNMTIDEDWRNWGLFDFPANGLSNDGIIQMEQDHDWALGYKP